MNENTAAAAVLAELRAHHHPYEHLRQFCVCGSRWPCYGEEAARVIEALLAEARR